MGVDLLLPVITFVSIAGATGVFDQAAVLPIQACGHWPCHFVHLFTFLNITIILVLLYEIVIFNCN